MAGLVLALPGSALAQASWSDKTEFTFDAPVEVPGKTLPAGKYVFKLADSITSRSIVEIWNEDETELMTTALTVPMRRIEPVSDVHITFASTPEGTPPAVKSWFYAGQAQGHEFVYPEEQARRIAKTTKTLILSADADPKDRNSWSVATFTTFDEYGNRKPWTGQAEATASAGERAQPTTPQSQDAPATTVDRDRERTRERTETTDVDAPQEQQPAPQTPDDRSTMDRDRERAGTAAATGRGQGDVTAAPEAEERAISGTDDYTHRPPNVAAAPGEAEKGSGQVQLHGLEGDDLAEHHLKHARRLTDEILQQQERGSLDRGKMDELRTHLDEAVKALENDD